MNMMNTASRKMNHTPVRLTALMAGLLTASSAMAAISLDRTRVIINGEEKSVSLAISNSNEKLPYLAQAWLEDAQGTKINSPFAVLPPVQRVEPGAKSQIKVQALPAANLLAQDRESLFYFNLREIPPKSDKPNTLQLALQTRVKLFYRPAALVRDGAQAGVPWQEEITLTRRGDRWQVTNPTPYYVTLVEGAPTLTAKGVSNFTPLMVAPKSEGTLAVPAAALGSAPVLTYINDYGGRPKLSFSCQGDLCRVVKK
jgi:P pilus assembly chaperone PapD